MEEGDLILRVEQCMQAYQLIKHMPLNGRDHPAKQFLHLYASGTGEGAIYACEREDLEHI